MKNSIFVLCLILFSTFNIQAESHPENTDPNNKVNFFAGSFDHAKLKAGNEGKLFFVEFYAEWCTPCKWMDKTTFKNEMVVNQLNNNYVPLKLDIETNQGQDLKKQYEVNILPTILIFNSQGRMIERIEKTLSSESMVSMLSFHNNPENRIVVNHSYNQSPLELGESRGPNLDHLYSQIQMENDFRTNYKLLIANYFDYADAHFKVKELQETFTEPIIVLNQYLENTTQYKVLLGEFKTISDADKFRILLKEEHNMETTIY